MIVQAVNVPVTVLRQDSIFQAKSMQSANTNVCADI